MCFPKRFFRWDAPLKNQKTKEIRFVGRRRRFGGEVWVQVSEGGMLRFFFLPFFSRGHSLYFLLGRSKGHDFVPRGAFLPQADLFGGMNLIVIIVIIATIVIINIAIIVITIGIVIIVIIITSIIAIMIIIAIIVAIATYMIWSIIPSSPCPPCPPTCVCVCLCVLYCVMLPACFVSDSLFDVV